MNHIERLSICNELQMYIELMNDEYGEYCYSLCQISTRPECFSENFEKALDEELLKALEYLEEHTKIVENIITPEPYTEKLLSWTL